MLSLPIYCQWTSTNLQFGGISCSANSYYEKNVATGAVRCIDDEIPFDIPNGWEWSRLNELASYRKGPFGSSLTKSMFIPKSDTAIKVYEQKNAIQKDFRLGEYYISKDKFESMQSFIVGPKDIIVSCAGTIGETYLLPEEAPVGVINQALMRVGLYDLSLNDFWQILFEHILISESQMSGAGSAIKNIPPFEILKSFLVPIPPLREQCRIVDRYKLLCLLCDEYDVLRNSLNTLNNEICTSLKKSILQEAIQGNLVPQIESEGTAEDLLAEIRAEKQRLVKEGKLKKSVLVNESRIFRGDDNKYYEQIGSESVDIDEEIPWIVPSNWSWCRLGEIVEMSMGKTPPRGEQKFWSNGVYPWVSIADLRDGEVITTTKEKVSEEAYHSVFSENISHAGNIVMSFKLTIGKISILGIDAFHNEAIVTISPYHKSHIFKDYLIRVLPYLSQLGNSKDAIKGKTLNSKSLYNIWIPLPPQSEMNRIITKIKEVDQFL